MPTRLTHSLANRTAELRKLESILGQWQNQFQLSEAVIHNLNITLEELLTNTIHYGYPDHAESEIILNVWREAEMLNVTIEDEAIAFDPLNVKDPDVTSDIFHRPVGGLGVFLVKKLMSCVQYQREGKKNVISLGMKLS